MSDHRNIVTGIVASVCSAAVSLAVVPLYLNLLGLESYGLIGVFTALQALVQLFDFGMSASLNRKSAQHAESGTLSGLANALFSLSIVYWATAICLGIVIAALSSLIASHWLSAKQLTQESVARALSILGVVIAARWPGGLYQSVLLGVGRLATTSFVNLATNVVGSIGAVLVLSFVSPTIEAFFLWQAAVGLTSTLIFQRLAWQTIGSRADACFDRSELRRILRVSLGMSGVAVTGMVLVQADKVILSKVLTLSAFGEYMLASTIASGLYLILSPTFNMIFPKLSSLTLRSPKELIGFYRRGSRLLASVLFPLAIVGVAFAKDILFLWTGNLALAEGAYTVVQLILIGTALNGAMHFPYALQLASGKTRLAVLNNLVLIVLTIPITTVLASRYGAVGGAASWAILNVLYLFIGSWLAHRALFPSLVRTWLVSDIGMPLIASLVVVGTTSYWLSIQELPSVLLIGIASAVAVTFGYGLTRTRVGLAPGVPERTIP